MKHANLAIFIPHIGCPHRCTFCDQHRISGQNKAPTPNEIDIMIKNCVNQPYHRADLTQIAFFGGSFTCIPREQMIAYLEIAGHYVKNGFFSGIRISTRPDGIDSETLSILKEYGVDTIELGAQSMNNDVLKLSERGHTAEDTVRAANLIKEAAFTLGLQMLLGLPGDTKEKSIQTARRLAALTPQEMRLYPAVVFPGTELYKQYKSGSYRPLTVDEAINWTVPIAEYLQKHNIHLLKVGLHQADGAVAGAFHPAFGELVRTGIWNNRLEKKLPSSPSTLSILVQPTEISIALGQKRHNLQYWKERGYSLRITTNPNDSFSIDMR